MNGITLPIVRLGTIRPEDSEMPQILTIKLHSETQVSGRLGMYGGRYPRHTQFTHYLLIGRAMENAHNNSPCPIIPTLTSSSVHHSSYQLTTTFLS